MTDAEAPVFDPERVVERDALPISETFLSIQGEGKLTGVPSFFIRVSGCNLRCGWCDTPYASWNPEGSARSIKALLHEAASSSARHVVVTGGEPMLFPNIVPLTHALKQAGLHVTIETAGTIHADVACDLMSISPKLRNSTPMVDAGTHDPRDPSGAWRQRHEARRINLAALTRLIHTYEQRQLKFVVSSIEDISEIERLLSSLPPLPRDDILLMPEGVTPPTPETRSWIIQQCMSRGWRYCTRLHIELFGNTRGT